jgi:hypothetical protein
MGSNSVRPLSGQNRRSASISVFPDHHSQVITDVRRDALAECCGMAGPFGGGDSYAAVWREQEDVLATGKVVLGPHALRLEGWPGEVER